MNRRVLARVGDVRGRVVVLLGNGTSGKELAFLEQDPALLLISDLSPAAVCALRLRWLPDGSPNVVFAAIDALDLPFADGTVDLLYGSAFVHHLPDVDAFLAEAVRVLAPGGRCVFSDNAYAPLWQAAKLTVLRPLMSYYHRLKQPSPEDLRFTYSGGFRVEPLASRIRELGCEPWFERSGFVHYFVTRASERLPPQRLWSALVARDAFLAGLIRLDDQLARFKTVQRNLIRLVWGLDKPYLDRNA
jgi:SAM-dependent methyltransferase